MKEIVAALMACFHILLLAAITLMHRPNNYERVFLYTGTSSYSKIITQTEKVKNHVCAAIKEQSRCCRSL